MFRLDIGVHDQGITEETYLELERLISDAKPCSRHLSQSTEYLPLGVSILVNACTDKPLSAKRGYVICRNSKPPRRAITLQKARFNEWRKYRALLTRVDTSTVPQIIWPEVP